MGRLTALEREILIVLKEAQISAYGVWASIERDEDYTVVRQCVLDLEDRGLIRRDRHDMLVASIYINDESIVDVFESYRKT